MNGNRSGTRQRHNRDITDISQISHVFLVRTVSYGSSFFPLRFMARALRTWAINRRGKNSVRKLRYGPQTRLVRGSMHVQKVGNLGISFSTNQNLALSQRRCT